MSIERWSALSIKTKLFVYFVLIGQLLNIIVLQSLSGHNLPELSRVSGKIHQSCNNNPPVLDICDSRFLVNSEVGFGKHAVYAQRLLKSPKTSHPIRAALCRMGYFASGRLPS